MKPASWMGAAAFVLAQSVSAQTSLSAQHQFLSSAEVYGGFTTTFEVTLTNTGTEALPSARLIPLDTQLHISETNLNALSVDGLGAGAQLLTLWAVTTPHPISETSNIETLYFAAETTDIAGNPTSIPVSSHEIVSQ